MGVLFFCDVDEEGKIVDSLIGARVIPMKQYDFFFYLMDDYETVISNVPNYRVVNGQLILETV
ncbi:hypothetical protein M3175_07730 [Robertmurraya korlensis]|uniref:hypothetical protein n=1 Tax=Robertmurraya korlensis TaxID=519977 RepID=UPI00203C56A2|nr:hypothetical protein [Robertmurraya korlensis]MCM3600617.1 hypothetical protein [Robertmurraya korlensis]